MATRFLTSAEIASIQSRMQLAEERSLVTAAAAIQPTSSTFLSHSTADALTLPAVIKVLKEHGSAVYIDKKDPALPPTTNAATAKTLKDRIRQCRKFIVYATPRSNSSTWVPWELGFADGAKTMANVALFPTVDSLSDTWPNREYYGLYSRITYDDFEQTKWWVVNPGSETKMTLSAWLRA